MWSVLKEKPLRAVPIAIYMAIVVAYLVIGFLPARAEAETEPVVGRLAIPAAGVYEDVTESYLDGRDFYVPEKMVGAYEISERKTLLLGHSVTAFAGLENTRVQDQIFYDGKRYTVKNVREMDVAEVDMGAIMRPSKNTTLVLMTCAGEKVGDKYSRRLIIEASAD